MLLDLAPADQVQGGLFDRPDSARAQARMRALDHLNHRFGRDTVTYGAAGIARVEDAARKSLAAPQHLLG
jgi:DNA polymerase V